MTGTHALPFKGAAAALLIGALLLVGCGGAHDRDEVAQGSAADRTSAPSADQATASLQGIVTAMQQQDFDGLLELTAGPAHAFFTHVRHHNLATNPDAVPFENVRTEPGEATVVDEVTVRFPGPIGYGTAEGAPPRVFTELELHEQDGEWSLVSFVRNDHPIEEWITPPPEDPVVTSGPISVEVTGVFADVGCLTGSDANCPEVLRDHVAIDLLVTNGSEDPIEPAAVQMPDGVQVPAWLETSSGEARTLIDVDTPGFPSGTPSPVVALFAGAQDLSDGGMLHTAFTTPDGGTHTFELPVPPYPHPWDAGR